MSLFWTYNYFNQIEQPENIYWFFCMHADDWEASADAADDLYNVLNLLCVHLSIQLSIQCV